MLGVAAVLGGVLSHARADTPGEVKRVLISCESSDRKDNDIEVVIEVINKITTGYVSSNSNTTYVRRLVS